MRLAFDIALRFLKSGKNQTILIALGISVGVAVQIFIGSLIQGLQISLIDTTIGSSSHITIKSVSEGEPIRNWERRIYETEISSSDIINISPSLDGPASISYDSQRASILIRGFILEDADRIYKFKDNIYDGSFPNKRGDVIIGKDLALKAGAQINDNISLMTNNGSFYRVKVVGIFDLGTSSVNGTWIVTDLDTAASILSFDGVTSIEMQVNEVFNADNIAEKVAYTISDEDLRVDNWKDLNQSLLSGLNGQSVSSYMIQIFVLVSVLLGISSVLAISVVQRSKQIGILKAMGIKDKDASLIFVFQGLMLGVLGAILGIGLGIALLAIFTKFALKPDGTPVVPIYLSLGSMLFSGVLAIITASTASLIPARITSKLNPIEVIRND